MARLKDAIDDMILREGGRYNLALKIMRENRELFTYKEFVLMELRAKHEKKNFDRFNKPVNPYMWTPEDEMFLMVNWNPKRKQWLAKQLKRSVKAIVQKRIKIRHQQKIAA